MHPPPNQRLLRQRFSRLRLCRLQHHHSTPKTSYIVRGQGATPALDPPRAACAATPCTCPTTPHLTPKTSDKTRGCAAHVRQLARDCLGLGPQLRHLRVADASKLLLQSAAAAREGAVSACACEPAATKPQTRGDCPSTPQPVLHLRHFLGQVLGVLVELRLRARYALCGGMIMG